MKTCFLTFILAVLLMFITNFATATVISEEELNNSSFATAQNLDGYFSLDSFDNNNNGICDIRECNTIPHVTVQGEEDTSGSLDFYSFTYTAYSKLIVDIDYNDEWIWLIGFRADNGFPIFDRPFEPQNSGSSNSDTIDATDDPWVGLPGVNWPGSWPDTITITLGLISFNPSYPPDIYDVIHLSHWTGFTGPENDYYLHVSQAPVPEPATILLMGSGLIGIGTFFRKKAAAT